MSAPVSAKVSVGALGGAATSALTWILTTYIPAFHSGIPPTLSPVIPAIVGVIGYFATGYTTKHAATAAEIETAFQDAEKVLQLFQGANSRPVPVTAPLTSDTSPTAGIPTSPVAGDAPRL